jgi:hypothetical protein
MSPVPGRILLIMALLAFAGCATPSPEAVGVSPAAAASLPPAPLPSTTPPPPAPAPTPPPAPVIELPPASITGSEETSTMLDNFTVFVAAVDGVKVTAGRQGWNTPLTLQPGRHRLTLGFNRGVFSAQAEVELIAVSKATYQARFASDAELFGKNSYCEFWIVDTATDQPVSPRVRSPLARIELAK